MATEPLPDSCSWPTGDCCFTDETQRLRAEVDAFREDAANYYRVAKEADAQQAALRARVAELEAALRAVAARLDQPVFRGDEKAGSAATARILRADIRSALVVAISAIDAARNAPIAGIGLPANKTAASNEVPK